MLRLFALMAVAAGTMYALYALARAPRAEKEEAMVDIADEEDRRRLRIFDIFDDKVDVCDDGDFKFKKCDKKKFPECSDGEMVCYNRRPRRDLFYADNRQPYYYIDYRNVYCYPDQWAGCSSCTPGRYCLSEKRCILDEIGYPCERWL